MSLDSVDPTGDAVLIAELRAELARAAATATEEVKARVTAEIALAAFRRTVVETALQHAERLGWCDEVYEALDDLGLTEDDGVPPMEREETAHIMLSIELGITVGRGQDLDTEMVEDALIEWVRGHFSAAHWDS